MTIPEKEWFIEAPWGRICIVAWGDCFDPPVLLCHGAVDSAACFRPLVQLLPRKFYYIAMELPGNGRSDPFPPGMMVSCYDLVFPIAVVVRHFRWQQFVYVGHSLATVLGTLYNLSYPGRASSIIEMDPVFNPIPPEEFSQWYHMHFTKYYENFESFNTPRENAPLYTIEEAITALKKNRGLSDEAAIATIERMSVPVKEGTIRYTFDQRLKLVTRPPFSPQALEDIFKSIRTPTLTILAEDSIEDGKYKRTPFKLREDSYPHGNMRVRRVGGNHDVHFVHPERVAGYVAQFLLHGLEGLDSQAKL